MARIAPWALVVLLIGGGLYIGLKSRPARMEAKAGDERAVAMLEDRARPWWKGHKLPMPDRTQINYGPPEKMGAFEQPPVACPVMPVEVARHLMLKRDLPSGHPFKGRTVRVIDMRLRSRHLQEHIPDTISVPWNKMAEALKSGELRDLDKDSVVILYGDLYPHFDATAPFRVAGIDAYYALEGGLQAWKAQGFPVETNATIAEYLKALNLEKVVGGEAGAPNPSDIGPAALKALIDMDIKPMIVFVGDAATFTAGRIPGATRVTLDELDARFEHEPREKLIAVYCGCCEGSAKGLSGIAVERLKRMKFTRILHLNGHLKAWKDEGYPLDVN